MHTPLPPGDMKEGQSVLATDLSAAEQVRPPLWAPQSKLAPNLPSTGLPEQAGPHVGVEQECGIVQLFISGISMKSSFTPSASVPSDRKPLAPRVASSGAGACSDEEAWGTSQGYAPVDIFSLRLSLSTQTT